jgi:hypothetical protein
LRDNPHQRPHSVRRINDTILSFRNMHLFNHALLMAATVVAALADIVPSNSTSFSNTFTYKLSFSGAARQFTVQPLTPLDTIQVCMKQCVLPPPVEHYMTD